jgi:hypothetical protein
MLTRLVHAKEALLADALQDARHFKLERDAAREQVRKLAVGRVEDVMPRDFDDVIECRWRVSKRMLKLHRNPEAVWECVFQSLKEELYKAHANLT